MLRIFLVMVSLSCAGVGVNHNFWNVSFTNFWNESIIITFNSRVYEIHVAKVKFI